MRSRLPAVTLLAMTMFLCGGGLATAGTVLPSPTPTMPANQPPAPPGGAATIGEKVPSGAELLLRMHDAMIRKGSVHVDFHLVSAMYPSGEAATHLRGDVSWKLNLLHDRTVVHRIEPGHTGGPLLQSIDLRLVHQRVASHNQAGGWQCENLAHVQVMSTLLGLQTTVVSAQLVGSSVLHGMPTWVVHATGYSPATGTGNEAHIAYDISQTDDTLQRVRVTGTSSIAGRTQRVVASETYTQYGETVSVQLPAECSVR
jgi:hypothetical protein